MLINSAGIEERDLTGWKIIIGASALSKTSLDLGINIYSAYGMLEKILLVGTLTLCPSYVENIDIKAQDFIGWIRIPDRTGQGLLVTG